MTPETPSAEASGGGEAAAPGAAPAPGPAPAGGTATGPGLFHFSIADRRAPALFVAGWLVALVGLMGVVVGVLAGATPAGAILYVAGLGLVVVGLILLSGSQSIERQAAGAAYAGPSPILVLLANAAGIFFVGAIVGTPLVWLGILTSDADRPLVDLLGVALQAIVVLGLLRLMVVGSGALSWRAMGLHAGLTPALRDLAWGAAYAVPTIVVTSLIVAALVGLTGQTPESPLPATGTTGGLIANLVAGAIIAPFYEELMFRGFATTAWARSVGAGWAIVRTSILFALAHIAFVGGTDFQSALGLALVAAASRLPVAFLLGWIFVRRRSIWASIGLHATFNATLIVLAEAALRG